MTTSVFELFQRGGPVMWPILICSITALAIALERLFVLGRVEEESERVERELTQALRERQMGRADKLCKEGGGPLARIAREGLRRYGRPRAEVLESMEESGALELPALERHIPMLGTIAHLAPLLGLLGTVTGLVRCFQTIQQKATSVNPVNPGDLAGGIWEALLTTVFGLLLAIPAYAMYNYLVTRVNTLANRMEAAAVKLADLLSEQGPRGV
ncbi:MAG: MotA/TolQ/ExbB proton channel family protein [Candidatus Omnitrophica bacterium]|nr:MotA/TolQ/ExbB proton channel family protein [Candidatus Omnitrophota bacterium]